MENELTNPGLTTAERNKKAAIFGLILGAIYIVITTVVNMSVNNLIIYYVMKGLGYVLYLVTLGILAGRIRKANGGFIEFKEVFGACFVMVLVACVLSYAFNFLYMYVIDPGFLNKMKVATLSMMEQSTGVTDEQLDEVAKKFDTQMDKMHTFEFGTMILGFMGSVVVDCLFGLIVCAIVKKPRPIFAS